MEVGEEVLFSSHRPSNQTKPKLSLSRGLLTAALVTAVAWACSCYANFAIAAGQVKQDKLQLAASSRSMIWNGVAVDADRVFVAGPRWTGSKGPAVAIVKGARLTPFPDAQWNAWRPGNDAHTQFVDVNAIHLDDKGKLWAVDTGSPEFGGNPLPGGAKLVGIDLATNKVVATHFFGSDVAPPGSYVDDVRFNGRYAYLTDAGRPGIIVVDLETGRARRVLDGHSSVAAPSDRDIVVAGHVVRTHDGSALHVNSDPLELSPDGKWLYYAPLEGPWYKIETRFLDDERIPAAEMASHVEPWADLPPTGGTVMDNDGTLYFSELSTNSIKRRAPDGSITTLVSDDQLHWVDAPFLDAQHNLWLPVPQMDRSSVFSGADRKRVWPVRLFKLAVPR